MEERILNKAQELFFSYGIKSVTMDDIARQMGISKKTIYQYHVDKNSIVEKVIDNLLEYHGNKLVSHHQEAENAIHEVALQFRDMIKLFQKMNAGVLFEVQKYFPKAWQSLNGHKYECVLQGIKNNLQKGIKEELYRPDLDIHLIAQIRLVQLSSVLNQQDFPPAEFNYRQVLAQITELYLYGISTAKGQKLISEYLHSKQK